nr:hypothetical protein [Streptomyces canus]
MPQETRVGGQAAQVRAVQIDPGVRELDAGATDPGVPEELQQFLAEDLVGPGVGRDGLIGDFEVAPGRDRHDGAGQELLLVAEAKRQSDGDEPADRVADRDDVPRLIPFGEQPVEGRLRVVDLSRVLVFRCPPEVQDQYGGPAALAIWPASFRSTCADASTDPPARVCRRTWSVLASTGSHQMPRTPPASTSR